MRLRPAHHRCRHRQTPRKTTMAVSVTIALTALTGCPGPRPSPGTFTPTVFEDLEDTSDESTIPFSPEEKAQSRGKLGGVWQDCYAGFKPIGDLNEDIKRLGQRCGPGLKLTPLTEVVAANAQSADDAAQQIRFAVPAGRCVRLLAVGAQDVRIDVAWLGPDGMPLARRGPAEAPAPARSYQVLPSRGPLCVDEPAVHTAEISVLNGTSETRLQLWVDE